MKKEYDIRGGVRGKYAARYRAATKTAKGYKFITAYACTQCRTPYHTRTDADRCCRCSKCKTKFPRNSFRGALCGHCVYGLQLREARAEVRRWVERLDSAKEYLAKLLKDKRPPKGAPQS